MGKKVYDKIPAEEGKWNEENSTEAVPGLDHRPPYGSPLEKLDEPRNNMGAIGNRYSDEAATTAGNRYSGYYSKQPAFRRLQ